MMNDVSFNFVQVLRTINIGWKKCSFSLEWFGAKVDRTWVNFLVIYWALVSQGLLSASVRGVVGGERDTCYYHHYQRWDQWAWRPIRGIGWGPLTNQRPGEAGSWYRDALTGAGQNHNFKPLMFMTARPIFCFWIHNLGILSGLCCTISRKHDWGTEILCL